MKNLAFILLFLPFLMSCSLEGDSSKDNIEIVEKYIKAVEELDYNTMESLLADNYRGLGPSFTDSINKEFALASWKYNVENLYDKIKYSRIQTAPVKISEGPNRGDWVSSWAELKIAYKSGETVVIWANTTYKVENGKIVKSFTFYNEADALRQMGYIFIHPNDL
jgi:limonene-1,2-epoxide hydrolase